MFAIFTHILYNIILIFYVIIFIFKLSLDFMWHRITFDTKGKKKTSFLRQSAFSIPEQVKCFLKAVNKYTSDTSTEKEHANARSVNYRQQIWQIWMMSPEKPLKWVLSPYLIKASSQHKYRCNFWAYFASELWIWLIKLKLKTLKGTTNNKWQW